MAKFILQKVLDKQGITQYRFAKMLGITPGEAYRYCQADYNPTLQTFLRIADILDVKLDQLVERKKGQRFK